MTIPCTCFVQAGQVPPDIEQSLRAKLDGFTRRAFGKSAAINWIVVSEGSGFTAGKPSTSSLVSLRAGEPVEQSRRVALLAELCNLWIEDTGCSLDEVVGVISDPSQA